MARIKDASVEAVKAAADIVAVVEARTQLRKAGARFTGLLPVPRGADAELLGQPGATSSTTASAAARAATRSRSSEETEQLDFVGAIEWLADRFSVPLEYEETLAASRTRARRRRERLLRAARAGGGVLRALPLGVAARRAGARRTSQSRGLGEEVCREFRLGLAPGGDDARAQGAREGLHARTSCAAAGLVNRRGNDYFHGRLLFPLADARGRVRRLPGAQAARGRSAARRSTSTRPRASSSARATCSTGSTARAPRSRSRTARSSSRATPTCSRCARPGSSRSSRRWARRSPSGS